MVFVLLVILTWVYSIMARKILFVVYWNLGYWLTSVTAILLMAIYAGGVWWALK